MKLTDAQERVLRELGEPGAGSGTARMVEYWDGYSYWFSADLWYCTEEIEYLIKCGLVTKIKSKKRTCSKDNYKCCCFDELLERPVAEINTAGRAWLAEHGGAE